IAKMAEALAIARILRDLLAAVAIHYPPISLDRLGQFAQRCEMITDSGGRKPFGNAQIIDSNAIKGLARVIPIQCEMAAFERKGVTVGDHLGPIDQKAQTIAEDLQTQTIAPLRLRYDL